MNGFINVVNGFSQVGIDALKVKADDLYLTTEVWDEVTLTIAQLNAYDMSSLTEQTKFIVTDEPDFTGTLTISPTTVPIWIVAETSLAVHFRGYFYIQAGADDVKVEGFLFDGLNSRLYSYANRTHVHRCRFDGVNGSGGSIGSNYHWLTFQSIADANPDNWTGRDMEVSYCDFWNYDPDYATSSIFFFAYAIDSNPANGIPVYHKLHHCHFKDFSDNANGSEPISMYTEYEPNNWTSNKAQYAPLSYCEIHDNLFEDCHSDGELCKGGINGTHFYNNTILRCVGLLSFRYGYQQKMYNNYTDGEGITSAVGACAFSAPDCEAYDNIFIGVDNFSNYYPLKHRYPATDYSGGEGMKLERNYMKGGNFNLVLGDDTATGSDNTADVNATIVDNIFVQGVASAVVNFDANFGNEDILLSSGNTWYGTTLGEAITGFTEVLEEPPVPPYTPLTETDVGIDA